MNDPIAVNQARWDEVVGVHLASNMYDMAAFKAGARGLHSIEAEELGDISGQDVLHLQCHFGMDSLALARMGARVTGLDFSGEAIKAARALSADIDVPATFVQGDVYAAPDLIAGKFDLVFVTWGTICWLPDIERWARVIAHFLRPGGRLLLADAHPFALSLDDESDADILQPRYGYFHKPEPLIFDDPSDYSDDKAVIKNSKTYEWIHPIGEIVTALADVELGIRSLKEYDALPWRLFPNMTEGEDRLWRLPAGAPQIPLSFSLITVKPG
jgi:SAM-dependent methyltransferase